MGSVLRKIKVLETWGERDHIWQSRSVTSMTVVMALGNVMITNLVQVMLSKFAEIGKTRLYL